MVMKPPAGGRKPCLDVTSQQVGNETRIYRTADVATPPALDGDNAEYRGTGPMTRAEAMLAFRSRGLPMLTRLEVLIRSNQPTRLILRRFEL